MRRALSAAFLATLGFGLFGCGGDTTTNPGATTRGGSTSGGGPAPAAGPGASGESGRNFLNISSFPFDEIKVIVDRDAIPALTDPAFVSPGHDAAAYLADTDLVLGIRMGGTAKAYPHNIGWWHEIVNDYLGGRPIVVTLCPLTGTGMVFDGQSLDDLPRMTAGVSGMLFNNNLIMYDRRDGDTLYPQMIATGIRGSFELLNLIPAIETTWGYWKRLYPDTEVVSAFNGVYNLSQYTVYPYGSYREPDTFPIYSTFPRLEKNPIADRFEPKSVVLGVRFGAQTKAYPFENMGSDAVINDRVGEQDIVVIYYDAEKLAVAYFRWAGQILTFDKVASNDPVYPFLLKDRETGTVWNLMGRAVEGELRGRQLTQAPAHNAFWFAWATFWQDTEIFE